MESRMDKYYRDDGNPSMQRSSKNAKLYRDVYSDYDNLENLPIPDNTNEIDIPELKKLMREEKDNSKVNNKINNKYDDFVKEKTDSNKVYDINKLLEHARNENNKLKDNRHYDTSNYKNLEALGSKIEPVSYDDEDSKVEKEDVLAQTRELKYQTKKISDNPVIEQIIPEDSKEFNTASLSLDILSDLKPTGDTGVTKPVSEPTFDKIYEEYVEKNNINDSDTSTDDKDVDIIKNGVVSEKEEKDTSFYTDFYKFSNKDFEDDEDDESSGGLIFKIILLFVFICVCCFAIFYFITNYGLN